ncbi:hypothetical protein FIBSPDRAFT_890995 [Athelia psychrophila]|uniref:Transmembrane protein n=1 Tax=Athelia psychrophila TaxID=1759441 RepID=A0A166K3P7_9AGAM|nr:hypothetical protein FIBSPDRAFT_890995 [Fibularhizoctonia sp. CBS 109695]
MPKNTILLGSPDRSTLLKVDQLCIWDWLISIPDEVEIAQRVFTGGRSGRLGRGVNIVYFVCRFSTFAMLLTCLLMDLVTLNSCAGLAHTMSVLFAVTQPATALLFYSRVSAIYLHEKRIVIFFGIFWLTIWACFLADAVYTSLDMGRIVGTDMCGFVKVGGGSSCIVIAVYDTFVYVAISWRLSSLSHTGGHWKARLASFTTGAGLYRLSKSLLRHADRKLYSATVGIIVTLAVFSMGVSPYINGQFVPFGYVIPTILACRLFRAVRIGAMSHNDTLPTLVGVSSAVFAPNSRNEHDHLRSDDIHVECEIEAGATNKPP